MALNYFNNLKNFFAESGANQEQQPAPSEDNYFNNKGNQQDTETASIFSDTLKSWGKKVTDYSNDLGYKGALMGVGNPVVGKRSEAYLNAINDQEKLNFIKQAQNSKAESRTDTNKMRDVEYLVSQGMSRDKATQMVYDTKANTVVNVGTEKLSPFEEIYQKEAAKQVVKGQTELSELASNTEAGVNKIDDMVGTIIKNPNLVGPYAKYKELAGAYTGGKIGLNQEEQKTRGEIVRMISSAKNDLIAEAKAQGQSGINTVREIEMATAGLTENSTAEQMTGALETIKRAKADLASLKSDKIGAQLSQYGNQFGSRYPSVVKGNISKDKISKYSEGQTATNPQTGEKVIFRGGTWMKI